MRICRIVPAAAIAIAPLFFATSCAVNPATGHHEFTLVSAGQELQIGREGYPATIAQYGLYDDPRLAAYVDSVGRRVASKSELPTLEWHFTVLDDPVVNAFAMPGGYIYVTRGILAHLNSEAQLAGVLGHEIGHVTARHSAKQITQQQIAGLGLAIGGAFSPALQQYSGAAQQALGLLMLKYSRDDETQADALGIRYATAAGYDPREIPGTYATLKRISDRAGSSLPGYLSTHPDPGDREARTSALAQAAVAGRGGLEVRSHGYLEHLRGVVFGDDPRNGWLSGSRFTQPAMGFELELPAGWSAQNGHAALVAAAPQQRAAMQWSAAANSGALAPGDYVAALRRDGRITDAAGAVETIGGWPAWVGRVSTAGDGGTTRVLFGAWVRTSGSTLMQCLAQSTAVGDADEQAIAASVRTLRPLAASRRDVEPDRVRIRTAPTGGTVQALLTRLGPSSQSIEEFAILNAVATDDRFMTGDWIKLVEPGRR
jgi:predicted Zn-dependent protease